MIGRLFVCFSLILFSVFSALICFASDNSLPVTEDEALRLAWKQNREIISARLRFESSCYETKAAGSLSNPDLTVSPTIAGEDGSDSVLLFTQNLELNGSRTARKSVASAKSKEEQAFFYAVVNDVSLRTKECYWELVKTGFVLDFHRENVAYFGLLKKKIEKQIDVGTLPGFHLSRADIELSKARQELRAAELEFTKASIELNKILGFEVGREISPMADLEFTCPDFDVDELLRIARENHPEIMAARAKIDIAKSEERFARTRRLPDLQLTARKPEFDSQGGVAVSMSLPLFDWGSVSNEIKAAQKRALSEEENMAFAVTNVESYVYTAIAEYKASAQSVADYENGLTDKAKNIAVLAEKAYEKGAAGFLDLMDARKNFAESSIARVEAFVGCHKALAKLRHSYAQFSTMEAENEKK